MALQTEAVGKVKGKYAKKSQRNFSAGSANILQISLTLLH